jgi:predicted thioredoxin/glutaredoxin
MEPNHAYDGEPIESTMLSKLGVDRTNMGVFMSKAVFYHAGCPVCVSAEQEMLNIVDRNKVQLEVVHFAQAKNRIAEAEQAGVKSVPALVIDGNVLHINFGASMEDVKTALK